MSVRRSAAGEHQRQDRGKECDGVITRDKRKAGPAFFSSWQQNGINKQVVHEYWMVAKHNQQKTCQIVLSGGRGQIERRCSRDAMRKFKIMTKLRVVCLANSQSAPDLKQLLGS